MDEITNAEKVEVINQRIAAYRRSYYGAKLDAEIGKDLNLEPTVTQAQEQMKTARKAIDVLERIKAELVKETEIAD